MDRSAAAEYVKILLQKLHIDQTNWIVESYVLDSQFPLITAFFKPYQIMCDITFTSGMGVENTKLFRHLFDIQPNAARFCMVIKDFLKIHDIGLKNYVVVLLVVFFLQQHNYLPSIEAVREACCYSPDVIDGNNI